LEEALEYVGDVNVKMSYSEIEDDVVLDAHVFIEIEDD